MTVLINTYFLIEMILYFIVFDFNWIWLHAKKIYFELILQIIAIYAESLFASSYLLIVEHGIRLCFVVFLLRMLRLLPLITELSYFKIILGTVKKFDNSFFSMILTIYIVFLIFSEIGMFFFEGKITTYSAQTYNYQTPPLFYLMNFNDRAASFLTLFHFMIVNNWFVTVDMYCSVTGSLWPRFFFALFWILCVCMMLNLVISFVLEVYSSVVEEVSSDENKNVFINNLKTKFEKNMLDVTIADIVDGLPYEKSEKLR